MPAPSPIVIDDGVPSAVTKLIREANEHLILVSPYNSFWDHLRNEIHLAITKRGVQVTVIYREGEKESEDIIWLREEGATVHVVDRLHAKLYLNESSVLLTSMNLLQSSREKSKEVGIHVNDADAQKELRNYVDNLIHLGSPAPPSSPSRREGRGTRGGPAQKPPARGSMTRMQGKVTPTKVGTTGHCIHCGEDISLNAKKPLCLTDYKQWDKKHDNPEKYCHKCGREYSTTFDKPFCPADRPRRGGLT